MILMALCCALGLQARSVPRKQLFNSDWTFCQNDSNFSQGHAVTLPHDWSVLHPFDRDTPAGNEGAYLPTGRGWYRKTVSLGRDYQGKHLRLYFEGVYMNAVVYVNGQRAGGWPYGYSSFWVDITPYFRIGSNEIVVAVDNSQQKNCRWYSGSGIYRNVWLVTTPQRYIDDWSVQVTTPDTHTVRIRAQVVEADGQRTPIERTLRVEHPRLWSTADPYLYHYDLVDGDDCLPLTYGIRTISYSAEEGFRLNGKPMELNGACVHHDNGVLGAAAYDAAEYRKARLMKEAGFNAVRTSHNPPSEAFLRACDELGLLVIDEVFDGWREQKTAHDYHELIDQWWQRDVDAMVLRDRNHPSIFCWSTGNEVIERKKIEIVRTAHLMAERLHEQDGTRPVTSALAAWDRDWEIYDPLAAEHDIVGYNYMIFKAESDHQRVPRRVMMQTESYPRDAWGNYELTQRLPYVVGDFVWTGLDYLGESGIGRWYYEGDPAGESWERPLYPWHAAYSGDVDLTGLRKPISHYRSILWNADEPIYMAVQEPDTWKGKVKTTMWGTWPTYESWTWPGWEGKDIKVEVYSRLPQVSLYLNDRLIGSQACSAANKYVATFTLPYQPGTLRAVGGTDGQASVSLHTAGEPAALRLTADKQQLQADGQDLVFCTVEVVDAHGHVCTTADSELAFSVEGAAAQFLAAGNADVRDTDGYYDRQHHAWRGRALVVLRSTTKTGRARLVVSSPRLPAAVLPFSAR